MGTDSLIKGLGSRTNLSDGPTKWMGEMAKRTLFKGGILTGSGKKFERIKVRIAEKVELFSSRTFFLQIFLGSYGSRGATTMAHHSF